MKCTADETTMEERRKERLEHIRFFMLKESIPAHIRRSMSLSATHDLLTGYLQNSHWRAAWFCIRKAMRNSWQESKITARLYWHYTVMRRTHDEVDAIFEKD